MTAKAIQCDACGILSPALESLHSADKVRRHARRHGWTRQRGDYGFLCDFCPDCSRPAHRSKVAA